MSELTRNELDALRATFDKYDRNANGSLNWDEFCLLLDELVGDIPLDEKSLAFHLVDSNHTGVIDFNEFSAWWGRR